MPDCSLMEHVNPYHQTLNDVEVVVDDLGQGSQAVGCAGSIAMEKQRNTISFLRIFKMKVLSQNVFVFHTLQLKTLIEIPDSYLTTLREFSYFSWLTPMTNMGASALGAEMMTLLAPPFR